MAAVDGPRDYQAEIQSMLQRADALRAEGEALDLSAATRATLDSVAAHGDTALAHGQQSSERAQGKIADAQERFKAGAVAQGYSLDEEIEESLTRPQPNSSKAKVVNKYTVTMEQKRLAQQQAKATG